MTHKKINAPCTWSLPGAGKLGEMKPDDDDAKARKKAKAKRARRARKKSR